MYLLLVFALVLLLAVLVSALAKRTVLSTAVLFLAAGFLVGDGMLGVVEVTPASPVVATLAELALFAVLFTDRRPQLRRRPPTGLARPDTQGPPPTAPRPPSA
jgi:NhaP-type Na+/H+ or K+/H+ antiporter